MIHNTVRKASVLDAPEIKKIEVSPFLVSGYLNEDCVYVAVKNNRIVGYCTVIPTSLFKEKSFVLGNLYIVPEYRRQRIGSKLVSHILEIYDGNIYLTPYESSLSYFYEKLGFQEVQKFFFAKYA